jgi:cold shock protein
MPVVPALTCKPLHTYAERERDFTVATGVVVRFDAKRGYGFINPDDGGADVFVHQNNIVMEGFRYLRVGEHVNYELEVGEKGMKAVSVNLLDERPPQEQRDNRRNDDYDDRDNRDSRDSRDNRRDSYRAPKGGGDNGALDAMRRKQERLISLLVEKGVLAPGELDGLDTSYAKAGADYGDDDDYEDDQDD